VIPKLDLIGLGRPGLESDAFNALLCGRYELFKVYAVLESLRILDFFFIQSNLPFTIWEKKNQLEFQMEH